jgi:hypothetical protein
MSAEERLPAVHPISRSVHEPRYVPSNWPRAPGGLRGRLSFALTANADARALAIRQAASNGTLTRCRLSARSREVRQKERGFNYSSSGV